MPTKKAKTRIRKKPNTISTDAALFTATYLKLFVDSVDNKELLGAVLDPFLSSLTGTTVFTPKKAEKLFEKALVSACDSAADHLSRVVFAEQLFKRLDLNDPKHIVTLAYCLFRLINTDSKESKKQIEKFKAAFGKYWRWPVVWHICIIYEVVKNRWESEASRGEVYAKDWQDQVQKFANNFWIEEKKKFGKVASRKKMMLDSFRRHPAIKKIIEHHQSSSRSKT